MGEGCAPAPATQAPEQPNEGHDNACGSIHHPPWDHPYSAAVASFWDAGV